MRGCKDYEDDYGKNTQRDRHGVHSGIEGFSLSMGAGGALSSEGPAAAYVEAERHHAKRREQADRAEEQYGRERAVNLRLSGLTYQDICNDSIHGNPHPRSVAPSYPVFVSGCLRGPGKRFRGTGNCFVGGAIRRGRLVAPARVSLAV